jgi:protease I
MSKKGKILIITGDAGEGYECLYGKHRFEEAGYESVIAAPSVKRLNLVIHDFEPGWDTYVEKPGYMVESDIAFDDVKVEEYIAVLILGGRAPEFLRHNDKVIEIVRAFDKADKFIHAILLRRNRFQQIRHNNHAFLTDFECFTAFVNQAQIDWSFHAQLVG